MSMKVLRCLGIRKRHMARKSPCFLRFLSSRSGPNVPHFFFSFFHAASLSWFLLVKIPSHGYDIYSYSLYRETENQTVYGQTYDRGGREKRNRFVKKKNTDLRASDYCESGRVQVPLHEATHAKTRIQTRIEHRNISDYWTIPSRIWATPTHVVLS